RPELEAAWRMLQHLYGIHLAEDSDEANQALGAFIDVYQQTPLVEFDRLVETLLEWGDEIFAFHDTDRITNGRIEGTNNRLGVLVPSQLSCSVSGVVGFDGSGVVRYRSWGRCQLMFSWGRIRLYPWRKVST